MEMKEYNILVIGLGNVGFQYDLGRKKTVLTHIKGLRIASQLMGIKINIQAVENNSSQRTLFQSYFPSYKVHESVDSITESNFDLAIICCTTSSILEMYTSVCKKLNVTKIIVEKPVVTNLNTYKLFENISMAGKNMHSPLINFRFPTRPRGEVQASRSGGWL